MSQQIIINYWIEKSHDDLASAEDNYSSGRYQNAVRDAYFACFHAFSSVLLKNGKTFKKHKEVRSILRARQKITSHFRRRCITPDCVPKILNMLDIHAFSRLVSRATQRLKLRTYSLPNP